MNASHRMFPWIRFLLILAVMLSAALAAAPSLASTPNVGHHTVIFHGVRYDFPAPGQSTWYYQVTSGESPAISHVVFELLCPDDLLILGAGTWNGVDMDARTPGGGSPDPWNFGATGATPVWHSPMDVFGLKFNLGFDDGETRFYYFTVNGNFAAENIRVAAKAGQLEDSGQVLGPSPACEVAWASLGDYVWLDADKDGLQEAGEAGLAGVTVRLFSGAGALLTTTTTNASGFYQFNNLAAGSYFVEFVRPEHPLYVYAFSPQNVPPNDAIDSDADRVTGRTHTVTLAWGGSNLTLDAGLYRTVIPPAAVTVSRWEATREHDTLRFAWTTASELNNVGFDLFAVQPGGAWIKLNSDVIPAQGLGLEPQDYTFEAVRPDIALDAVFYLRAYDLNGTHEDFGPITATVIGAQPVADPAVPPQEPVAQDPVEPAPPRRNTGTRFLGR